MAAGIPVSYTFRDDKMQTAVVRLYMSGADTPSAATLSALNMLPLFQAVSNATVTTGRDHATANVAGVDALYESVEDKMVLVFQTAFGALHRYKIPAPKATCFLADGETVDYTNADVAALVAQFVAQASSRDGDNLSASVGGYRQRVKTQRKFNVFTRNPTLSGQGL
jgi:hypothetical protein